MLEISSFYISVPKTTTMWGTVPEIRSNALGLVHQKSRYDICFLRNGVWQSFFFVILCLFCLFTPLPTWKIKILKKWNISQEILSFYTCVPQMIIIWWMVPEIWSATDIIFSHVGPFFALLPAWQSKKSTFWKKWKCRCTKNYDQMFGSWHVGCHGWTDGKTGRRTEKVTYRGGYPT